MKLPPVAAWLLVVNVLAAPVMAADDRVPDTLSVNGFRPLPQIGTLPGQAVSLEDADEKARANLPPPCTGRSRAGVETGVWVGAIAGLVAGAVAADKNDDKWEKAGKGLAGAAIGSTVGYVAGRIHDGNRDCPGTKDTMPNARAFIPMVDELAWEDRRRALAGGP